MNSVCVTGVLERDPRTKFASDGAQETSFTLRVEESGKDGTVFRTFVPVEAYGRVAEKAADLSAGDMIGVEGKLKWQSYTARDGTKKTSLCVLARLVKRLAPVAVAPMG